MSDPFNGQLKVSGGNNFEAPKRTPRGGAEAADPLRDGHHKLNTPSDDSKTHVFDQQSAPNMDDLRQKADAAKQKYMQENGVDENGDPVRRK